MTVPGGVPNLPAAALTLDTMAAKLQDMSGDAMKERAVERMPGIFNNSTGLSPALEFTPFGILTRIWAEVNSLIAKADPADIQGPEDLPELVLDFIEGLPLVGQFVGVLEAIVGDYDGDDQVLLAVQEIFMPIRTLMQLISGQGVGFPTVGEITAGWEDLSGAIVDTVQGLASIPSTIVTLIVEKLRQFILGQGIPSTSTGFGEFPITWDWLIPDDPAAQFFKNLRDFFVVDLSDDTVDVGDVITGVAGGTLSAAYSWITFWYNAITGQNMTNVPVSAAAEQAAALADNMAALAAAQAAADAQANGNTGIVGGDDFERVSPTSLGSGWVIDKIGTSASVLAIADGHNAAMVHNDTNAVHFRAIRDDPADRETMTDTQLIEWVEGSDVIVSPFGGGTDAHNDAYGRVNAAHTHYVRAVADAVGAQWTVKLFYAAGGAEAQLGSTVVIPVRAAGSRWQFYCGTNTLTGLRIYQIRRNNQIIINYNDTGNLTSVGALFRRWGFGLGGGSFTPSSVTRVTVIDNSPTATVGTFGRMSRISTSAAALAASATGLLPASFFDTVDRASADLTPNVSSGTWTVRNAGPLDLEVSMVVGIFAVYPNTSVTPYFLQALVNGAVVEQGAEMSGVWTMQSGTNALSQSDTIKFTTRIYCPAGAVVSVGYNFPLARNANGTADGLRTYFKVSR